MTAAPSRPSPPPSLVRALPLLLAAIAALLPSRARADLVLDGGAAGWDVPRWRAQVDGVMGGRSSGRLSFEPSGAVPDAVLSFSGTIVTDGGGFSSVRKRRFEGGAVDLTPYAGVVVTLETTRGHDAGDVAAPLGMHLQFGDESSGYMGYASAYAIPLSSETGAETSVYLPLESFDRASRGGWTCRDCRIDFSVVNEMDLYVLFQEGPFEVRVKEIRAVDEPQAFPSPVIEIASEAEIKALIEETIKSGGGLYDYGYVELCNAVYRSTLNSLLAAGSDGAASAVSGAVRGMICQGLQRAAMQGNSKSDAAWTLRYTMDGILEELGFKNPGQGWRPDAATREAVECRAVTSGAYYVRSVTSAPTPRPTTNAPTILTIPAPAQTSAPTLKWTTPSIPSPNAATNAFGTETTPGIPPSPMLPDDEVTPALPVAGIVFNDESESGPASRPNSMLDDDSNGASSFSVPLAGLVAMLSALLCVGF